MGLYHVDIMLASPDEFVSSSWTCLLLSCVLPSNFGFSIVLCSSFLRHFTIPNSLIDNIEKFLLVEDTGSILQFSPDYTRPFHAEISQLEQPLAKFPLWF